MKNAIYKCIPVSADRWRILSASDETEMSLLIAENMPQRKTDILSVDEYKSLINHFLNRTKKSPYTYAILLILGTGMRISDAIALKEGNIFDDASKIFISDGNSDDLIGRVIYVPINIRALILEYAKNNDILIPKEPYMGDVPFFCEENKELLPQWASKLLKKTPLTKELTFPLIRESFGSFLLSYGATLVQLHRYMGGKDISYNYKVFGKYIPNYPLYEYNMPIEAILERLPIW